MIVLKIYGIPESVDREAIAAMIDPLRFAVKSANSSVSTQSVFVFFVPDMVQDGLGEELYVEVSGVDTMLWPRVKQEEVPENVAQALEVFARAHIPQCRIVHVNSVYANSTCSTKYIASR